VTSVDAHELGCVAFAGSGALPSSSSASGASRSSKASSAAGKYSRSWWRSRWTCRVVSAADMRVEVPVALKRSQLRVPASAR